MSAVGNRPLTAVDGAASAPAAPAPPADDPNAVVDEWGASRLAVALGRAIASHRWNVSVGGADLVRRDGGALLITNPRPFTMSAPTVALVLGERLGRTVRFAGLLDVAPASLVLRRLGGVLARPDEVESALRGGHAVVVGTAGASGIVADTLPLAIGGAPQAGVVPPAYVAAARRARAAIHPVAVHGSPFGRRLRIEVAAAVRPRLHRRGPLAAIELAERVEQQLQRRLDEIADGS